DHHHRQDDACRGLGRDGAGQPLRPGRRLRADAAAGAGGLPRPAAAAPLGHARRALPAALPAAADLHLADAADRARHADRQPAASDHHLLQPARPVRDAGGGGAGAIGAAAGTAPHRRRGPGDGAADDAAALPGDAAAAADGGVGPRRQRAGRHPRRHVAADPRLDRAGGGGALLLPAAARGAAAAYPPHPAGDAEGDGEIRHRRALHPPGGALPCRVPGLPRAGAGERAAVAHRLPPARLRPARCAAGAAAAAEPWRDHRAGDPGGGALPRAGQPDRL
ncbi:MAG: hypothetical protein AVDCRST_MAG27-4152, partial [uncultured Craurococcus sp.]